MTPTVPPLSLAQKLWGWALDYAYVVRWTVRGLLSRATPEAYLEPVGPRYGPVLLVPGVYESWRFLQPVAEHLYAAGYPVHVLDTLGHNTGAIPAMADVARRYLHDHDLTDVAIVAHSKGGLIGKYALADPDTVRRVRRLIAVNSPFAGSRYARLFWIESVRVFAPGGPAITELARHLDVNTMISSLYSAFDPHIPETSHLQGAENVVLPTVGHFRPLGQPATLALIVDILRRDRGA